MPVNVDELQNRVEAVEDEVKRIERRVDRLRVGAPLVPLPEGVPMDGTILEYYAEIRRRNASRRTLAEARRALGIPEDLPRIGAEKLQEKMLAEGVKPEDRILSSEIIRMREEG